MWISECTGIIINQIHGTLSLFSREAAISKAFVMRKYGGTFTQGSVQSYNWIQLYNSFKVQKLTLKLMISTQCSLLHTYTRNC